MARETHDERILLSFLPRTLDGPELVIEASIVRMEDERVRNIIDDSYRPNGLADLKMCAHITARWPENVYFHALPEYRDTYAVNLVRGETMVRTLRTISRGLQRIETNFGAPRDYADNLARVAKVLGIKSFGWCEVRGHNFSHDTNTYAWGDVSTMMWKVSQEIESFRNAHAQVQA